MSDKFSFRWGIPILDAAQKFTPVYDFMLRRYADLGLTCSEFVLILHLASRHYELDHAKSCPSLQTVADEMGMTKRNVQKLVRSLQAKEMLRVIQRLGETSIYDCSPFAQACLEKWLIQSQHTPVPEFTPRGELQFTPRGELQFTPRGELQFTPPMNSSSPETKESKRTQQQKSTVVVVQLSEIGVRQEDAEEWVNLYPPDRISEVITASAVATKKRAGWIRKALEEGWQFDTETDRRKAEQLERAAAIVASLQQDNEQDNGGGDHHG